MDGYLVLIVTMDEEMAFEFIGARHNPLENPGAWQATVTATGDVGSVAVDLAATN